MTATSPTKGKLGLNPIQIILAVIAALGVVLGVIRIVRGLGPTTNLSNGYPWGLWIAFDFFAVPFSAGAFTLAFVTQIANRKKYHGIAHLALLAGFLGYLMVVLVLILDINRWDQFWNVLLPWRWNLHSFMFEVAMSITLYFTVLVLELVPIVSGKKDWIGSQIVNRFIVLIASLGVLLSTVHQASIGAIFLVLSHKLHPLWWSPILPLLFLTSAIFSGLSVAILLGILTWRALKQKPPMKLFTGLAKVIVIIQIIYLALKIGDLLFAGELGLVFTSGGFTLLYLVEIIVGVIVPLIIFASRARETENGLLAGTICVVVGLFMNRWTQAWFALQAPTGASYAPHWIEWAIVIAAVSAGIFIFSLAVSRLDTLKDPILSKKH
ncbi:MAG: polysulfide reductase NrfD [Anaerolineales bacterium]|nr:polysulfide reductase NrfD [Anaerolineales bacterium]